MYTLDVCFHLGKHTYTFILLDKYYQWYSLNEKYVCVCVQDYVSDVDSYVSDVDSCVSVVDSYVSDVDSYVSDVDSYIYQMLRVMYQMLLVIIRC